MTEKEFSKYIKRMFFSIHNIDNLFGVTNTRPFNFTTGERESIPNCRCLLIRPIPPDAFMTDDEKIDYHLSKKIFKTYGVEV